MIRARCALCASPTLDHVMSLPDTPPANAFVREPGPQPHYPLQLVLCARCGHLQLGFLVDPHILFTSDYVYTSGTSPVTVQHFDSYAAQVLDRHKLPTSARIVEIGSNDGTFLRQFKNRGYTNLLGIDPAAAVAPADIETIPAFFDADLARNVASLYGRADLLLANNVFAHTPDILSAMRAVRELLAPDGLFVFEVSYLVDVVEKCLFDTIYHEHYSYHAVAPLCRLFEGLGMQVCEVERVPAQGGSIRVYVKHSMHGCQLHSVTDCIEREHELGLFTGATYQDFKGRIMRHRAALRAQLDARADSVIVGYGAPAKLTTLMYTFGLTRDQIKYIVDDSTWKQGLHTPGLHIPVHAPDKLYQDRADTCVVFAWNFADSIVAKHREAVREFIVPMR